MDPRQLPPNKGTAEFFQTRCRPQTSFCVASAIACTTLLQMLARTPLDQMRPVNNRFKLLGGMPGWRECSCLTLRDRPSLQPREYLIRSCEQLSPDVCCSSRKQNDVVNNVRLRGGFHQLFLFFVQRIVQHVHDVRIVTRLGHRR